MSATPISVPVSVIWTVRSTGQSAEATPATPLQVSVAQVHIGLKGAQGLQGLQGLQGYKGDKGDKGDTGDVTPAAEAARNAAQTARDDALTHAGTAGTQAGVATTKAGEAAASVVLAEAARDAAFVNADVYADVATGLAAVADGVQFQVVSADGLSIQRYRRDAGPVAVAVGVPFPTADAVSALSFELLAVNDALAAAAASAVTDYVVDSVTGSDSYSGQSNSAPFRSFAPVVAMGSGASGKVVGVARGSQFERVAITPANVRVHALPGSASLGRPVFDPRRPITGWALVSGVTWSAVVSADVAEVKHLGNIWKNGVMLPQYVDLAALQAAPVGGCYVSGWATTARTVYITSTTNPNTDGSVYVHPYFGLGLEISGDGAVVEGVSCTGNAHQDGALRLTGWNCTVRRVLVTEGCRHNVYAGPGLTIEDSEIRSGRNDLEGSAANTLVVNAAAAPGTGFVSRRNRYVGTDYPGYGTGPLQHDGNSATLFGTQISEDDEYVDLLSWASWSGVDARVIRPRFENVLGGAILAPQGNVLTVSDAVAGSSINQLINAQTGGEVRSARNQLNIPLLGTGFFRYVATTSGDLAVNITADKYVVQGGVGSGFNAQLIRNARGAVLMYDTDITQPNDEPLCAPIDLILDAGFVAASTYQGDRNKYPFGSAWKLNGATYYTLASWQAATGQDAASLVRQPVNLGSDDFNRANEILEANAFWTRIGGVAGQATVESNQLSAVGTTQTMYAHEADTADHFVRFTVAAVPATAGPYVFVRGIDQGHWIGIRWNVSTWQIGMCVAGAVTASFDSSAAVAPTVGDDVVLAVKGANVWLYVNGRLLRRSSPLPAGAAPMAAATKVGVVPRSTAIGAFIDNFAYGQVN